MNPASSVAEALDEGTQYLARHRPRTPRLDAEVLLCHVIGHNRTQLYVRSHDPIAGPILQRYRELLERRAQGAPVAYLVGSKEFYGRSFSVTPAVLIPRPEIELVVEEALQLSSQSGLVRPRLLDVGTGSGCLAITLALEVEEAVVRACDVSPAALEVAAENLRLHHLERRIKLFEGDLLEALPERIAALEDEQTALHARMADPALYQNAPQEVAQIKARMEALDGEIEAAMLRWEELESRAGG